MTAEKKPLNAEELFQNISHFVADSRSLMSNGQAMELNGLDTQVRALCEQVLRLSQDDRLKYADLLQELLEELQTLGTDMQIQKEALVNEIRYLSSHKKAAVAYKIADGTDRSKKNKNKEEK